MNRFTKTLLPFAALLLFIGLSADTARAQVFATPGGLAVGLCATPATACNLFHAVEEAKVLGPGTVVFNRLNNSGAPTVFVENLVGSGRLNDDLIFDTYLDDGGPTTGVSGTVVISGQVIIGAGNFLTIPANLRLELTGQPGVLEMRQGSSIVGDGDVVFTGNQGDHRLQLGQELNCPTKFVSIENMVVDKGAGGEVVVLDGCIDLNFSELTITNRLTVSTGTLEMNDNTLNYTGDVLGLAPGVVVNGEISGAGVFRISPTGFPNTRTGSLKVSGSGFLNIAFDKDTDAGVTISIAQEIGRGGESFNHAGTLFVTQSPQFNGTFRNDATPGFGARTEFDKLAKITGDLELVGFGESAAPNGCDPSPSVGNDSGVYFFAAVTIDGDVNLMNTDDVVGLPCRPQGVFYLADTFSANAAKANVTKTSVIKGIFTNDGDSGVYLGSDNGDFHNLQIEGKVSFDESPVFVLEDPAVAADDTDLCGPYTVNAPGNKVIFAGGLSPQSLEYNTVLAISSVQINKNATGQNVVIDAASAVFLIDTSLEVLRGNFVTNGLLDANSGAAGDGNTVVINWDGAGIGVLLAGTAARAYTSDSPADTPDKVKYTGTVGIFTGAELPGTTAGSVGQPVVSIGEIEVAFDPAIVPRPVLTLGKSITVLDELRLTSGEFDVGSATLQLANEVLVAIGNGDVKRAPTGPTQGKLEFPSEFVSPFDVSIDGIDLLYFGTEDRTVGRTWPASDPEVRPGLKDNIRDVTIDPACDDDITISLREEDNAFRINRDLVIELGTLDINGDVLEINTVNGVVSALDVFVGGDLTDSTDPFLGVNMKAVKDQMADYRNAVRYGDGTGVRPSEELLQGLEAMRMASLGKAQGHAGLLLFMGTSDTDVTIETTAGRLRFDFPAIEVNRTSTGNVTFDASGVLATTVPPIAPDRIDELGTRHFTLTSAATPDGVELLDGLDLLDIGDFYLQQTGGFLMAGVSSIGPAPTQPAIQEVRTGGNFTEVNGEFRSSGGDVTVFGDFLLGKQPSAVDNKSDGLFSLATDGFHTVVGDFTVGFDTDPCTGEVPLETDQCFGIATAKNDARRNRYFLGDGTLDAFGNYTFQGTGDVFDDKVTPLDEQGLRGEVRFVGNSVQDMTQRQDEDAFFNDVTMSSTGEDAGILLQTDGWQNKSGVLVLRFGIIDTNEEQWDWIILNPGIEPDLVERNNSALGKGVVQLGSRDSYVNGAVQRVVELGNATGGLITGGYLFPVGTQGDPRTRGDVDFFRPLILQFPDNLGRASVARGDYLPGELNSTGTGATVNPFGTPVDLEFRDLVVPGAGGDLLLNVLGDQFWLLEFDRIPSWDPNVRLEAQGLPNVNEITDLRILQWDCDGNLLGLAGRYDLDADPTDDPSFFLNDFIDGVPNITQEGVNVLECNILGISSDFDINPINLPPVLGGFARVQLIHNSPDAGAVDIYVNDRRVADDADFQTATGFKSIPAGSAKVDIVAGADADNSNPVFSQTLTLDQKVAYVASASGRVASKSGALELLVKAGARLAASSGTVTEFFFVHGGVDVGVVDLRLLDPVQNNAVVGLLANNVDFGSVGNYLSLTPGGYNIQVTNADNTVEHEVFRFDFNALGGETFTFLASGTGNKASQGFTLIGFDIFGNPIRPQVVTASEGEAELPTEFALEGNYPNPFNPSTTIQFDLPETAEVSVEVIDMLGRNVMTVPAKMVEAGAKRSLQINAVGLASGTYLYRLIAKTVDNTMVKTGRMTLVK